MGNQVGAIGGGTLSDQILIATSQVSNVGQAIIAPAVQTGTVISNIVHRKGANVAIANFNVGAIGSSGNYTVKVQDSADGVNFADLASSTQASFGSVTTAAGALKTANTDVQLVTDLRQAREYIQYVGSLVSGTSVLFGVTVVLGAFDTLPATQY